MAIHYHVCKQQEDGRCFYVARTKSAGTVTFEYVRRDITSHTFLHGAELVGAVTALTGELIKGLQDGQIVDLGGIGRFQVCVGSGKVDDPAAFGEGKKLRSVHIVFRPSRELREMLKTLEFKEVK